MKLILITLAAMTLNAFANNAPANFPNGSNDAVFVDFINAEYSIKYDMKNEKAIAYTKIVFTQNSIGTPIFDLIKTPTSVLINGEETKSKLIASPDSSTSYRTIEKTIAKGTHTLEIRNEIQSNIQFQDGGVQSAFWMSDLDDRKYLEQYLPTNIEYDHYKMDLHITFAGASSKQTIYTNGAVTKVSETEYNISYPEYFTASSMFFHTVTEGRMKETSYTFNSINGKKVPVTIYSKMSWNLNSAKRNSEKVLKELESKFGAWSHPSLVVYIAGQGGMEHCGATMTSLSALGHEITHSYFARGVMPIDGNSGWMDEAIASWRDGGYQTTSKPNFSSTSMAAHSQYQRTTDRKAYTQGANFMAYLNHSLSNVGGLEKFLNGLHTKYTHTSINTEKFRNEIETFSGLNFGKDFDQYIYGQESTMKKAQAENPFHPKLSKQDLLNLL